jgi:hypothetical protein
MSETTETGGSNAAPEIAVDPTSGEGTTPAQADTNADAATADEADADDPGAETPRKPGGGFQKRISELTADKHRAIREAEYWREQAARGTPAQPTQQAATPAALPQDIAQWIGAEPKPSDFAAGEFDPAYIRAATVYDVRKEQAQAVLHQRQAQVQHQQAEFGRRMSSMVEDASRADPAVADAVSDPAFPMPAGVVRVLMECDKPAAVLAHLAKNREEAQRIAALGSPTAVARALDRIEQKLAAAPPPRPSNAPPPPRTVRGGGGAATPDLSRMSMEDYARHRRGQ